MKYIIKNCPAYSEFCKEIKSYECQDIENCLLKQIVEKCRDYKKPLYEINNGDGTISAYYSSNKDLSLVNDILNILLEIEEVNE